MAITIRTNRHYHNCFFCEKNMNHIPEAEALKLLLLQVEERLVFGDTYTKMYTTRHTCIECANNILKLRSSWLLG